MQRRIATVLTTVACLTMAATPAVAKQADAEAKSGQRVVVLVSGTAATTPFTTPKRACRTGFSAGNTWEFIRDYLVKKGYKVYTAPASIGGKKVKETSDT